MLERRPISEFRFNDARTVSGVAMRYGAPALIGGIVEEFRAGSFGDSLDDVRLDVQHDRRRILTRTGAGLELQDSANALIFRANLPNTRDSDDALELVRKGVLRGASVEFVATAEQYEGRKRIVKSADLVAISLVDDPAYKASTVEARTAPKGGIRGSYKYGALHTVKDRGKRRKTRLSKGALQYSIEEDREITLSFGSSLNSTIATRSSGNLAVKGTDEAVFATVGKLPDTQAARDMIGLISAGNSLYLRPVYQVPDRPNAFEDVPESGNEDVTIRQINEAVLLSFNVGVRGGDNGYEAIETLRPKRRLARRYYA